MARLFSNRRHYQCTPSKPLVLYTRTGHKFEFSRSRAAFHIRTIGPYVNAASFWGEPEPRADTAAASVNKTFLSIGLDRTAATVMRLNRAEKETGVTNFNYYSWAWADPPASEAAQNQKLAGNCQVTPEEERALASWYPALMSYFNSIGQTPDLKEIMFESDQPALRLVHGQACGHYVMAGHWAQ